MHIGLIGGIGVASTVVYYQRLTATMNAKGAPLQLTLSHGDVHTLIKNNLADLRAPQADIFADQLHQLKGAGADAAALTSLGAHYCYDALVERSPLPLISAVTPLDSYFASLGLDRVGLLGTRSVMRSRLFGQLHRTTAVALDDEMESLGQTYLDMAVAGQCSAEQRQAFFAAGDRLVKEQGAQAIVLAGTDLNLAFDGRETGYRVIDALDVHVDLLARVAAGETALTEVAS